MHIDINPQRRDEQTRVRVPGLRRPVVLGDAIKAATSAVGVKPCGGCQKRSAEANRVQFVPWDEEEGG